MRRPRAGRRWPGARSGGGGRRRKVGSYQRTRVAVAVAPSAPRWMTWRSQPWSSSGRPSRVAGHPVRRRRRGRLDAHQRLVPARSPGATSRQLELPVAVVVAGGVDEAGRRRRPRAGVRSSGAGRGQVAAGLEVQARARPRTSCDRAARSVDELGGEAAGVGGEERLGGRAVEGVAALVVLARVLLGGGDVARVLVGDRRHDHPVDAVAERGGDRGLDAAAGLDGDLERQPDEGGRRRCAAPAPGRTRGNSCEAQHEGLQPAASR